VVSTCEELAEPWAENARMADELNRLAKDNRVSLVGTGVNPGFAMDILPLTLTVACEQVERVRVRRVVDASRRRLQLQKKIGTGLSAAAFAELAARREIRHVGLTESTSLLARGLKWELDSIQETIEPVLATRRIVTDHFTVDPRFVTGVKQIARGVKDRVERISLELLMSVDAGESSDEVWIEGHPNLHSVVKGIHGDISTAAVAVNAARRIHGARPGLLTMLDLPLRSA
jgi:4-hydroxy-tetrahydrodipicolinate reductase